MGRGGIMTGPLMIGTPWYETLQSKSDARSVSVMTTNHTARVTQLIGELLGQFLDEVPDDQVVTATKEFIHNTLDNGYQAHNPPAPDPLSMHERQVWELAHLLGFTTRYEPWQIEAAILPLIDSYDLFND